MPTLHQTLKLQHRRHTGKLLHHRHTSYRALAVVFVVAGMCIMALNIIGRASADSTFGVSAMVAAPLPTTSPVITSPDADTKVTGSSALVVGSCPVVTPQVIISVSVDGTQAGTSACDSNNDFSVPVSLSPGTHQITAGSLTITGQSGPSSSALTITSTATEQIPAIAISASQPFLYAPGKNITWSGSIGTGDTTEYVHVDWGDDTQSNYTVKAGTQSFSHTYATLASHDILFDVADSAGGTGTEQFAAATFTSYNPVAFVSTDQGVSPLSTSTAMGLYGLYLTAVSVTAIIWLEARHTARQHATA